MHWKKFFAGTLAVVMIFSLSVNCSAAPDISANAKLIKIEIDTYGSEQGGALIDRLNRLENNYSGRRNMSGNMNARIDAIYDILYDNSTGASILAKVNALEWNANHEVASGGIASRLTMLESQILGRTSEGTFNDRIRALSKASYGNEILPITQVQLPVNLMIKVATDIPIGSKTLQVGDKIPVKVIEDVFVDGTVVFVKGLRGEGTVTKVHRARNIFSNGKIETDFKTLSAIDGQETNVYAGIESIEAMKVAEMAPGLRLVGRTFSGKNRDLDSVLVHGKNIDLPAGIELYLQLKTPIVVYGVQVDDDGSYLDEIDEEKFDPTTMQRRRVDTNTDYGELSEDEIYFDE